MTYRTAHTGDFPVQPYAVVADGLATELKYGETISEKIDRSN